MAKIENIQLLENVFGHFPSFHDAEVLRIALTRKDIRTLPTLEAEVHVFEMTSEIKDERYVLQHHSLVTFQFLEIDELSLNDFNNQNVLQGLFIQDVSSDQLENIKFEVSFDGIHGMDARFKCSSIKILSVTPFSVKPMFE